MSVCIPVRLSEYAITFFSHFEIHSDRRDEIKPICNCAFRPVAKLQILPTKIINSLMVNPNIKTDWWNNRRTTTHDDFKKTVHVVGMKKCGTFQHALVEALQMAGFGREPFIFFLQPVLLIWILRTRAGLFQVDKAKKEWKRRTLTENSTDIQVSS